jgi:hypothetical protein
MTSNTTQSFVGEFKMSKKLDKLRRLVQKLGDRYGKEDGDVLHLQQELDALETLGEAQVEERRKQQTCRYTFGSIAKRHFLDSKQAELQ